MTVTSAEPGRATCKVDVGGKLSDRKGVNTPSIVRAPAPPREPAGRRESGGGCSRCLPRACAFPRGSARPGKPGASGGPASAPLEGAGSRWGAAANTEALRLPARTQVLPISPLTPKDRKDLEDALAMDVDWVRAAPGGFAVLFRGLFYFRRWLRGSTLSQVALSFVQRAEDMQELRELVRGRAKVPPAPAASPRAPFNGPPRPCDGRRVRVRSADHGQDREAVGGERAGGCRRGVRRVLRSAPHATPARPCRRCITRCAHKRCCAGAWSRAATSASRWRLKRCRWCSATSSRSAGGRHSAPPAWSGAPAPAAMGALRGARAT
jgi:hypothetical protein